MSWWGSDSSEVSQLQHSPFYIVLKQVSEESSVQTVLKLRIRSESHRIRASTLKAHWGHETHMDANWPDDEAYCRRYTNDPGM